MDIPPSPPGSPPPAHDTLTAKFDTFLRLKRTTTTKGGGGGGGIHFNARLASSQGMRNPSVMDTLRGVIGVDTDFHHPTSDEGEEEEGRGRGRATEQYATVLPADVWDPHCFPAWAYKGELRKAQERGARERERGRGEAVEFVSAGVAGGVGGGGAGAGGVSGPGSAAGSRSGTPGVGGGKRKGRFDVM
jgi:hypothetical protein